MRRVSLRVVNKRVMENLVYAGAFDSFGLSRGVFFTPTEKHETFIENLLKYGSAHQGRQGFICQFALWRPLRFGQHSRTKVPKAEDWNLIFKLQKERDVIGIYLSGHPLDDFRYEWETFASPLANIENFKGRKVNVAGFVLKAEHRISQKGTGWGRFTLQDYTSSLEITHVFGKLCTKKFKSFFEEGTTVYVEGEYKQRYNSDEMEFRVPKRTPSRNHRRRKNAVRDAQNSGGKNLPPSSLSRLKNYAPFTKASTPCAWNSLIIKIKRNCHFTSMAKKVTVGNEFIAAMEVLGVECGVN